jgi:DNA-binding beta-propeller fold protein YncE
LEWGHRGWGSENLLGMNWPRDLTANQVSNTIWLADTKNNRLVEFNRNGLTTGKAVGKFGTAVGQLHWPYGITSFGKNVIVADTYNNRVQLWDTSTMTVTWTATGLKLPWDVQVVGNVVWVADTSNNRIVELSAANGGMLGTFPAALAVHSPKGVAIDASGNVWVSDTSWDRIVEFAPNGAVIRTFGKLGSAHGQFNRPTHLEIVNGKLYVCDEWNDRIEVFTIV